MAAPIHRPRALARHRSIPTLAVLLVGSLILAACSGGSGASSSTTTSSAAATSAASDFVKAKEMTKFDVNLGFIPQARMSPLYYGVKEGLFSRRNLDVTISPASGTAAGLQQLVAGGTQAVIADLAATVKLMAKSPDVKLKSYGVIFAKSSQTIFFLKGKGISEPKDLEGKTIATSAGSNEFALFPAFAAANGIDASKVNWKVVDPKIKVGLLLQGTVDATSTTVFGLAQLQANAKPDQEIGYFQYGDYGVNLYGASLVVDTEWASQHADAVEAFVQATMEAFTAGMANPDASIAAMKEKVPTLDEGIAKAEMKLLPDVMVGAYQKEHGIGVQDPELVKATYDEAVKEVGSSPPLPYTDYFSNDYLIKK